MKKLIVLISCVLLFQQAYSCADFRTFKYREADTSKVENKPLDTGTDILSFALPQQKSSAIINNKIYTVNIDVYQGTDLTSLTPIVALSSGATIRLDNVGKMDLTKKISYTVIAEDRLTKQDWTVNVNEAPNSFADILDFVLEEQKGWSVIDPVNFTVDIYVPVGTDVTALSPVLTLSTGATSNPASGEKKDFSNPVIYTVEAEDGIIAQDWIVRVYEEETTPIIKYDNNEKKSGIYSTDIDNIQITNEEDNEL